MKKIYLLLCAMVAGSVSFAQAFTNGNMEAWHNGTTGASPKINIQTPDRWYGIDSLVIDRGEVFGTLIHAGTDWKAQLFEESTIIHGGTHSARMMTLKQDTLGLIPGGMTNAAISVDVAKLLAGGSFTDAVTYKGGTAVTLKIDTVKAWVAYFAGIDTTTHVMGGKDSGVATVNAYAVISGTETLIGTGKMPIPPSATFTQMAIPITYTDTVDSVGIIRVFFASSGGAVATLDSSTLYVDDVTMTGKPEPVKPVTPPVDHTGVRGTAQNNTIKVYPNPATGTLYIDGAQNAGLTCRLYSVSGQQVVTAQLKGNDAIDISTLAAGSYFYTITDAASTTVQNGKVTVAR